MTPDIALDRTAKERGFVNLRRAAAHPVRQALQESQSTFGNAFSVAIELDHLKVSSSDRLAAAELLAKLPDVPWFVT